MSDTTTKPKRQTRRQKAQRMLALKEQAGRLFKEAHSLEDELKAGKKPGATIAIGGGQELVLVDNFTDDQGRDRIHWARSAVRRCEWETRAVTSDAVAQVEW